MRVAAALLVLTACHDGGIRSASLGAQNLSTPSLATVIGTVRDADSHAPLVAVRVTVAGSKTQTREDGAFALSSVTGGAQSLALSADGYQPLTVAVTLAVGSNNVGTLDLVKVAGACSSGLTTCSTSCADLTSNTRDCGACEHACASTQTCSASSCIELPFDCTSTACPINSHCDAATHACLAGCVSASDCPTDKTCDSAVQQCVCAASDHLCEGSCVAKTSPLTCGDSCTPCLAPAGATPTCTAAGHCDYVCAADQVRCAGGCCAPLTGVVQLSATGYHASGAVTSDHTAYTWGNNFYGQSGDGTTLNIRTTATVVGGLSALQIHTGTWFACAISTSASASCWGRDNYWQLGDSGTSSRDVPGQVSGLTGGVSALAAGGGQACAVVGAGLHCWGSDSAGQVGDASPVSTRPVPQNVVGMSTNALAVSAGGAFTCALTTSGAAKCFGANDNGELGNGSFDDANQPVDVAGLSANVTAIAAGDDHACAVVSGAVKCWGSNTKGEVGDGTYTVRATPVSVTGLASGVTMVAAGGTHSCALLSSGSVKCWGYNNRGQLGDGTIITRPTPVDVVGLMGPASAVSVGEDHSCALLTSGRVMCWGDNSDGQCGDSTDLSYRATPVVVVLSTP